MSNRVDDATRPVSRPCTCEGKPHAEDTYDVRERLGYGELAAMRAAGWERSAGAVFSNEDAKIALLTLGVVRWNLVLPDGKPREVSQAEIELLDEDSVDFLWDALQPAIARKPLPNVSGAHSPSGSRESAGRTRTTTRRSSSTTT